MDTIRNLIEGFNLLLASNIIYSWLLAALIVVFGYIILRIIKNYVHRQLIKWTQKSETKIDDHVTSIVGQTKNWFLLALAVYGGSFILVLPDQVTAGLQALIVTAIMIQVGLWGIMAINIIIFKRMNAEAAKTITRIIKVIIWTIIALLALDNLPGVSVDTLIASLGVTGIIIGLAVQGILGDLFSSFLITLDRPIEEGDYIVLDEYSGMVEKIGWKSTRIRSISGELIIVSNSDLVNSRLRNYQRMPRRRITHKIGVLYQTTSEQLARIPEIIQRVIEQQEEVTFEHANLAGFGDSSVDFSAGYYVNNYTWIRYMNVREAVNLELFRCFEEEGIGFAYPTQTIFLEK